jgi:indole-3-glycerol phosphate synthase
MIIKKDITFIAEVKTHSPSGFKSTYSWEELFDLANKHGDWISVHTHEAWRGSFGLVKKAREMTRKPILAKGLHESDDEVKKALDSGANYVLVYGRIPEEGLLEKCLVEPKNFGQLIEWKKQCIYIPYLVWNKRDLSTMKWKKETFSHVRDICKGWLCQASGIRTIDDVSLRADAILVGEYLPKFMESYKH